MANELSPFYMKEEDEKNDETFRELFINDAIELIIISLATYFILKYKYYKHHIISIVIIVIVCIFTDIFLKNFTDTDGYKVISSITLILADSFLYSYFKYLIDYKYYYYLDILYIYGIFGFICFLLSFIIIIIIHSANGSYEIFYEFYSLYSERGVFHIILRFVFFGLILQGFGADILEFLMLDKLSPNYIIIGYEMGRIPFNLITNEGFDRWIVLIFSVIQFLSLLFYLEILEFNFCSLNENTRKNIKERELSQILIISKSDEDNNSGVNGYYITDDNKGNETDTDSKDEKKLELTKK